MFKSLLGRENTVKMSILPTVNYTLRMLPVTIQNTWFEDLHKTISTFIWHGEKGKMFILKGV